MQALSLIIIAFSHSFFAISFGIVLAFAGSIALKNILDATAVVHHSMAENRNILGSFMTASDFGAAVGAIAGYTLTVALGYNVMYLLCALTLLAIIGIISIKRS
jgi:predicted MFS family arabinose efflux permease